MTLDELISRLEEMVPQPIASPSSGSVQTNDQTQVEVENNTFEGDNIQMIGIASFHHENGSIDVVEQALPAASGTSLVFTPSSEGAAINFVEVAVSLRAEHITRNLNIGLSKRAPDTELVSRVGWTLGNGEPITPSGPDTRIGDQIDVKEKEYFMALLSSNGRNLAERITEIQDAAVLGGSPTAFDFYDYFDDDPFMETWPKDYAVDLRDLSRIYPVDRLRFRRRESGD